MKISKIVLIISNVAALCLEIFAKGAVCNFATPEKTITKTYSYFSLTPYGYANFGPFITAVITCLLFIFALILLTQKAKKTEKPALILSGIAVFTSLLPLIMFGVSYFNIISVLISLLMITQFVVIMLLKKQRGYHNETQ